MKYKQCYVKGGDIMTKSFCIRHEVWDYIKEYADKRSYTYSHALCEIIRRFRDGEQNAR